MALKKKKKLFGAGEEENEEMALQITSMADIFTIILVFLLKSFSTGMASITPTTAMQLPSVETDSKKQMKEALTLEIGRDAVLVDQKVVAKLNQFQPSDDAGLTETVKDALMNARLKTGARTPASTVNADGTETADSRLLVLSDESTPYSTLKDIMNSAAAAGYVDLQLVVTKPE